MAKDMCYILDITNSTMAIRGFEDDEKGVHTVDAPDGNHWLKTVSESGLYVIIMES